MGAEADTARIEDTDQSASLGEASSTADQSNDLNASGQEHSESPSESNDQAKDGAEAVPPAPESQTKTGTEPERDYAAEALAVMQSINGTFRQQPSDQQQPAAGNQGKTAESKPSASDDDELADILKAAREDFGDDLADKVIKPFASKIRESITKSIEDKYKPLAQYVEQQKQAETERTISSAIETLYGAGDSVVKQAIGTSYEKASEAQKKVVHEIFTHAGALRQAQLQMGKNVSANDAVKQAAAYFAMEFRKTAAYQQTQQRNRARTVSTSQTSRSKYENPTVESGDKDRDEITAIIGKTLGRR